MSRRVSFLLALAAATACAEPPPATSPETASTDAAPAPTSAPSVAAPTATAPEHAPAATSSSHAPVPVPPLSTPNALAQSGTDAGAAPGDATEPKDDARTAAVRRVAVAARTCYTKHVAGAQGKLMLRVTLAADGHVTQANIEKDATSASLRVDAFEKCVIDAARKQTFPAPNADDVDIELPLDFKPAP